MLDGQFGDAAAEQDQDQPRADGGGRAPPASRYPVQRSRRDRQPAGAFPARRHQRPPAWTATAATAAPAPAPAPRTHSGGVPARKSTDRARITTRPGTMNAAPPASAPGRPRTRQAQKIASWVEAGPGQQVARGDRVLELPGVQPPLVVHAQLAQQRDVRGRAAEPDAADPPPLPQHGAQAGLVLSLRFTRGGIWRQAPSGRLLVGRVGGVRHRISRGQAGTARPDPPAPR